MTILTDITNLLENTRPPNELLCKYENHYIPIYSVQAFQDLNRPFHMGPYTPEEKYRIMQAKVRADVDGSQSRMDLVWRKEENSAELFVGNKFAVEDANYLHVHGITHVLNMANNLDCWDFVNPCTEQLEQYNIALKNIKTRDIETANISEHFNETSLWINEALNQNEAKVLVACWQGASRSATVAAAYLVQHADMGLVQALSQIRQHRDVRPNNGFIVQLIKLEQANKLST